MAGGSQQPGSARRTGTAATQLSAWWETSWREEINSPRATAFFIRDALIVEKSSARWAMGFFFWGCFDRGEIISPWAIGFFFGDALILGML